MQCLNEDNTRQSVLFPDLFSKPLRAQFDERHGSSDGGAILLKACDASLGPTRRLSQRSGKTAHVYGQTRYAARHWKCPRRVIIKAEVVRRPGRDPNKRFNTSSSSHASGNCP
jgi:hypothetical protein